MSSTRPSLPLSPWIASGVVVALGAVLALDLYLPLGVAGGVPYVLPVLLTHWLGRPRWTVAVVGAATLLTLLGWHLSPPGGETWKVAFNRGLALFAIGITGLLILARLRGDQRREGTEAELRTATLAAERGLLHEEMMAACPEALLVARATGEIVYANAQAGVVLGHEDPTRLHGTSIESLIPEGYREAYTRYRKDWLDAPRADSWGVGHFDVRLQHADGTTFPVEASVGPLVRGDGVRALITLRDLSAREAQARMLADHVQALGRSNQELSRFAYVASHDLQEPLRAIHGFCELLESTYGDAFDDQGRRWLEFVTTGARRMKQLIQDLLDYSRLEGAKPVFRDVALDDVVAEAAQLFGPAVDKAQGTLTVATGLDTVRGNPHQLLRLVNNLLENAIKFREPTRTLEIAIEALPDGACGFQIRDNGVGVDPKHHGRIFDMFERLHRGPRFPGTGIGLALCRRIVDQHGGRIALTSCAGDGATFEVHLTPAATAPSPPARSVAATSS